MITEKQREERRTRIGSSDIPVILGLSKFSNPYELWLRKTGQLADEAENAAMRIGTVLEAGILQLAGERLGVSIIQSPPTFEGPEPWAVANVDGMIGKAERGSVIVEAKSTGIDEGWGEEGTDQIPEQVMAQVQWQMMCASSDRCHVVALIGRFGLRLAMYEVAFDRHYAEYALDRARAFRRRVETMKAPSGALPSADALRSISRRPELPSVALDSAMVQAERDAYDNLKAAEKAHEDARAAMLAALGQATVGECPGWRVKVSTVSTTRVDTKRLQQEHPAIVAEFMVESMHNRVTITRRKGD